VRRIRWRVAVSAALTTIDIALLFALTRGLDLPVVAGDVVAVVLASILSWLLHRSTTFALDPEVRWVRMPGAFALAATLAGAVDVTVTSLLAITAPLLVAKVAGIVVAGVVRLVAYRGVLATDTRKTLGTRRPLVPAEGDHGLTVVVPAKDESARIGDTVRRLREDLADLDVEVVVVDDGSSDDTAAEAERAGARVERHEANRGKGAAVRTGVMAAGGRTIAFTDADLAYSPAQVRALADEVAAGWDVAVGDRFHPASRVEGRSLARYVLGRLFNAVSVVVLLGQYRDTQCGCKAFRADVARSIFARTRLDGFAIDVEVLHLVELDRRSLIEVPVHVRSTAGSTVDLRRSVAAVRDVLRVRRWSAEGAYDRAPA